MTNIDTNVAELDHDQFAALFDEYLDQKSIREQSVVTGKVISIEGDWVTITSATRLRAPSPATSSTRKASWPLKSAQALTSTWTR